MTATETKAKLPSVLDDVAGGEEVLITRHGRVIAYATAQVNGWRLVTRDGRVHEHGRARSVVVW